MSQALGHAVGGHRFDGSRSWLPGTGLGCCDSSRVYTWTWATGTYTLMVVSFLEKKSRIGQGEPFVLIQTTT